MNEASEISYIGMALGQYYRVISRMAYSEDMKRGLYRLSCSRCGTRKALIWIDLEWGHWTWERMCLETHSIVKVKHDQRMAVLLVCTTEPIRRAS